MGTFANNTFSLAFALQNISGTLNSKTVSGNYQILPSDNIIYVNASGPVNLTLPATPALNQFIMIKDISGAAAANNITVIGTIDGVVNPVIGSNYGGALVTFNSTNWSEHA